MADSPALGTEDGRESESPNDQHAYHKAEEDLQDHILAIYGDSSANNDMFRPALADNAKIGFFSLDSASQTEVTEIVDLKEMTEVLQILLQDVANLRRDINFTKHVMQADHDSKLQEKSLELYCRINERVVELEKMHQDRVNSLRKAFRQQLADAIARLSVHFSKNLQTKIVRERTKQKSDLADKEEKFKEMQATILRNEGVIQMLKTQLQQQQMKQQEEDDERFMERRFVMDESSSNKSKSSRASGSPVVPRVDSALQDQLNTAQEELEEATQKLEKSDKKISRLEEALDIKDEEILTLHKEMDAMKEQQERSEIMVEQLKHEHNELMEAAAQEKETTKKMLGHQKEEMKRMMDEQLRLAKEEAVEKAKEEAQKASTAEQSKMKQMKSQLADLEKKLAKEKEKSSSATQDSISSKTLKESEDKLKTEILRLQAEVEKAHRTWEKKFAILQQSMHALKDESYLRQTLQRQAAQLHHAAVSYSTDMPSGVLPTKAPASSPSKKPLPEIRRGSKTGNQAQERDYISYTVSAPSGRGTAMFSADENQIMSDNELDLLPPEMEPLPEQPSRKGKDCGDQSRPSTQPHVVVLPTVEAK
ncbi:uncharacterized protein C10orf67, mitochondrial isoform X2 [Aplysia californica]|uniref:Uncharacterized protein C10orf67, mitochondrial isoform X2 n=1 Tax=Aplysia californica TaxID=6500 RepID=A0ABM1VX96_APLCA|nr:uncharacterized protein C10orf67, mitochondrial isoform X2 [Aplysia californica]